MGKESELKAAYLTGIREVEIRDVPEPELTNPTDVKLRVEAVGVCGSDMHYYRTGRIGDQVVQYPWTVGHEISAKVVEVGSDVAGLPPDGRVAVDPLIPCGQCDQCLSHREHTCRNQAFMGCPGQFPGALVEYLVIPARCCSPVPDSLTVEQTVLIEPFSIGLYSQRLAGDVSGAKIAVLGCGPIGLSVLLALRAGGECTVYMTDILDNRAALARELGAAWTGNPRTEDVVARILEAEPLGVDLAYECAGEQETADQCLELLSPGGTLMLVGIPEEDRISFEMNAMRRKEVRIQNVRRQNRCVAPAIEMIASGGADVGAMVTHRFPLGETGAAFDMVCDYRDDVVKAIIHLDEKLRTVFRVR